MRNPITQLAIASILIGFLLTAFWFETKQTSRQTIAEFTRLPAKDIAWIHARITDFTEFSHVIRVRLDDGNALWVRAPKTLGIDSNQIGKWWSLRVQVEQMHPAFQARVLEGFALD